MRYRIWPVLLSFAISIPAFSQDNSRSVVDSTAMDMSFNSDRSKIIVDSEATDIAINDITVITYNLMRKAKNLDDVKRTWDELKRKNRVIWNLINEVPSTETRTINISTTPINRYDPTTRKNVNEGYHLVIVNQVRISSYTEQETVFDIITRNKATIRSVSYELSDAVRNQSEINATNNAIALLNQKADMIKRALYIKRLNLVNLNTTDGGNMIQPPIIEASEAALLKSSASESIRSPSSNRMGYTLVRKHVTAVFTSSNRDE